MAYAAYNLCIAEVFTSGHQIFHYHGVDTSSDIGYFIKSLGDINNDGFDDISVNSHEPYGTLIFFGGNPPDSTPDLFLNYYGIVEDFIDYSGDGLPDLVLTANYNTYLFLGNGYGIDTIPSDSILSPIDVQNFWSEASGYVNDNSIGDLLFRAEYPLTGSVRFVYLDPFTSDKEPDWTYALDGFIYSINHAGFVDFNGDNETDIFMSMGPRWDSLGYAYIFFGPNFGSEPDIIIGPAEGIDTLPKYFARGVFNIGDVNGDGWEDLGLNNWVTPLVYTGGPEYDTIYDFLLDGSCQDMASAGDINGDNYNDLVLGGSDCWDGRVILYFGGPNFDGNRDGQIDRADLPPIFLEEVGKHVSTAGDFNRDGYDDVLFSCRNFAHGHPGDVFIFSWGDDITDVMEEDNSQLLPENFFLYQNYPNPFNPTTTIEFEMPRKDNINLDIYNILGRKIRSLITNKQYSPGKHVINWDGYNQKGEAVSSGIYFYKLSGSNISQTKKMVLVR